MKTNGHPHLFTRFRHLFACGCACVAQWENSISRLLQCICDYIVLLNLYCVYYFTSVATCNLRAIRKWDISFTVFVLQLVEIGVKRTHNTSFVRLLRIEIEIAISHPRFLSSLHDQATNRKWEFSVSNSSKNMHSVRNKLSNLQLGKYCFEAA